MPVVQKDLIQWDKEMTQVNCERQYEWGSALGKYLDLSHVFDFFFWHAWLLSIPHSYHWLSTTPTPRCYFAAQTRCSLKHLRN